MAVLEQRQKNEVRVPDGLLLLEEMEGPGLGNVSRG